MKKTKKLIALIIAIMMIAGCFAACSKDDAKDDTDATNSSSESSSEKSDDADATKADDEDTSAEEDAVREVVESFDSLILKKIDSFDELKDGMEKYTTEDCEYVKEILESAELMIELVGEEDAVGIWNAIGEYKDAEIKDISIDGDEAEVSVLFTTLDENAGNEALNNAGSLEEFEELLKDVEEVEKEQTVYLEKIDGEWLITEIEE